eukprot:2244427-Pyramimonas_sp.AAC.1
MRMGLLLMGFLHKYVPKDWLLALERSSAARMAGVPQLVEGEVSLVEVLAATDTLVRVHAHQVRGSPGGHQGVHRGSTGGPQGVHRGCTGGAQGVHSGWSPPPTHRTGSEVECEALNIHVIALNIHTSALNIRTSALNIRTNALNIARAARWSVEREALT